MRESFLKTHLASRRLHRLTGISGQSNFKFLLSLQSFQPWSFKPPYCSTGSLKSAQSIQVFVFIMVFSAQPLKHPESPVSLPNPIKRHSHLTCHLAPYASPSTGESCRSSAMANAFMTMYSGRLCVLTPTAWCFQKSQFAFPTSFPPSCTQLFFRIYADCCSSISQITISYCCTYSITI